MSSAEDRASHIVSLGTPTRTKECILLKRSVRDPECRRHNLEPLSDGITGIARYITARLNSHAFFSRCAAEGTYTDAVPRS